MDLRGQLQETLGNSYNLERELGGGGMSRVFVADERRLNRKVVIKVLSPELAAGVSADRFEREIQLAASLQQANIVPILAAGETQGLPFYTMPFVEGESMRARLAKGGALPVSAIVGILRDVARALSYAHERGVVHRDIKPDNVLLSGGTAVVTDFGIAKAISAAREQAEGSTLTQLGTSIGTPSYMSPEQAAGDPSVDHRADIYSLGCMAYELLTGQAPFHGRTPARTLAAHMTEVPRPVTELRADTPAPLAALVMRCLEKDPASRPQTGAEVIQSLDSVTSSGMAAMPMLDGPGMLQKSLLLWLAALVAVAILARAAIVALGLPDWVFPGALFVMLLGLPVIFFTWYVSKTTRRIATTTPAVTPGGSHAGHGTMATLALKASPHVSWRRTWLGGATALGAFIFVVGAFMVLRALGIGPAGSLLAAGRLNDRERLIVTEFQAADTTLSTIVNEAVRTNLSQSRVISIMPPTAIAATLGRMQRPPASRIDLALAREIAQREGVKAIIDGSIRSIGSDYVISLRLVTADSAIERAAFQATASGTGELLEKIDELTRKMRGRIGESLRDVRDSPPIEQVTTPSFEALRIYAEATRALDRGGSPIEGAERLREAVKIDTAFAMAWRKLGVALSNAGLPRARSDSAFERAYRLRDRLTERERLLAEGSYFGNGPGRDRRLAARAYEAILALDSADVASTNNLANIYMGRRDFARAEALHRRAIAAGRGTSVTYQNLIGALYNGGRLDEAQKTLDEYRRLFPTATAATTLQLNALYQNKNLDSLEKLLRSMAASENPILKINGLGGLANYSVMRGRLSETMRYGKEAQKLQIALGGQPPNMLNDSLQISWIDLQWNDDTARAVRRVDQVLTRFDIEKLPWDQRPYLGLASFYASAGNVVKARAFAARDSASIPNETERRIREPGRHGIQAAIALAEKHYADAIRAIWRADTTYDGPNGSCGICLYDDLAWTYDRAGTPDSAIHYFEQFIHTPFQNKQNFAAGQMALMHKRLGELYEAKGDATKAAENYRAFLSLWANADAQQQPKVAEVRRKLSRLADVETKR
jgi:tRNA A-37 threonylcarbamoyl transferase component Bud32/tetratricopeptide (TPR) repeat protein